MSPTSRTFHFERRQRSTSGANARSRHSSAVEIRSLDLRAARGHEAGKKDVTAADEKENHGDAARKVEVDSSEGDASVAAVTFSLAELGATEGGRGIGGLREDSEASFSSYADSSDSDCSSVEDVVIDMSKLVLVEKNKEKRVLQPLENDRALSIANGKLKDKGVQARFAIRYISQKEPNRTS